LLCRVIVETPSNLDRKQSKLLKQFTDALNQSKNYPGTESFSKAAEKFKE
jgi:molecular chaperone DnaJ